MRWIRSCFVLCLAAVALCGCDVVPYGLDCAEREPFFAPLSCLGLDYERGTHDVDVGEVRCVLAGAAETRDMARAYESKGWKVLLLTPDRLVVTRGDEVVEVEMKVFVTRNNRRKMNCDSNGMQKVHDDVRRGGPCRNAFCRQPDIEPCCGKR